MYLLAKDFCYTTLAVGQGDGWMWINRHRRTAHLSKKLSNRRRPMWKTSESPVPGGGLEPPRA